jgi:hypothetical protein
VHEIGFDRTTGAVMEMIERCPACDGTGSEWIEGEPLDEADLAAWMGRTWERRRKASQ